MKEQIDKLLLVYKGPTDEIGWDGLLAGEASYEYGERYKATNAAAAAVTDGQPISSTEPTFGVVTINPAEWGTLDTISNQVKKVSPMAYSKSQSFLVKSLSAFLLK